MPEQHDDEVFDGLDAPRHMPPGLRGRVETGLLGGGHERSPTEGLLADIDAPRPLPALARARIERTLLWHAAPAPVLRNRRGGSFLSRPSRWAAAAAAIVALLSSITVVNGPREVVEQAIGPESGVTGQDALFSGGTDAAPAEPGVGSPGFAPPPAPPGPAPVRGVRSSLTVAGPSGGGYEQPPPFAFRDELGSYSTSVEGVGEFEPGEVPREATTTTLPPRPPPYRISVVGGDPESEAGFRAYVRLRNEQASHWTRRFELVSVGEPADVTVNLSGSALTTSTSAGVRIESLLAPDRLLRGNVFNFAGALDRQAHLIVDVVYPQPTDATAVIYREPGGVLHDDVAAAMESALREKGVRTLMVDVRPNEAVVPVPADAVFLSLVGSTALRVVDAYPRAAQPRLGFNGVGTLAESTVALDLPPGTRFISPYAFPASNEATAVKSLTGLPAGARVYHGWIAAKTLAVAVWGHQPDSAAELAIAFGRMANYANGFAPAYTFRPGTNSVQPEGVLFLVGQDGASQVGGFRTDTRG